MAALLPLPARNDDDAPVPAAPAPVVASHPLHVALRELAHSEAGLLAADFVERLDGALQALCAEARNVAETRAAIDLGDALRLNRATLLRRISQAFVHRLDPLAPRPAPRLIDVDRLSVLPSDELEETIALAHLSQQAERLAGETGRRLRGRLTWAARDLGLPALAQAFEPSAPGQCFAAAFRDMDLSPAQRLLAYRLVESHALPLWPAVLEQAQRLLDHHSLAEPLVAGATETPPLLVAEPSLQCLREMSVSRHNVADAELARRLLQQAEEGGPALTALAAAGQWLDSLLAEPQLPQALLPDLESLRFPLLKAAVADPSFFTVPGHGLRRSINALAEHFALAAPKGLQLAPLRRELRDLLEQIAISGAFARDLLPHCEPLSPAEIEQFFEQQRLEQQARREALLMQIRCQVSREVEEQTLGSELPEGAAPMISGGFLPLLAATRLRHGAGSPQDREARALLQEFTDSFAAPAAGGDHAGLLARIGEALLAAGLREERVNRLLDGLRQAYAEARRDPGHLAELREAAPVQDVDALLAALVPPHAAETPAPVRPPAGAPRPRDAQQDLCEALKPLLRAEQWFRVHDPKSGDDRWLCLSEHYAARDLLSFRGPDGVATLGLRASQFVLDLIAGRAEPLNSESELARLLRANARSALAAQA